MKHFFGSILGGDPTNFVAGVVMILSGLVVLGDGQIGIQATPTGEVHWITLFAVLPNWIGWLFIWFGLDSFFDGRLTKFVVDKVLSPILTPIAKSIIGEERLKRLQAKLEHKDECVKWVEKTYKDVLDGEATNELALIARLKLESPELFDYFYREVADGMRHRGITGEMIKNVVKYLETA